MPSHLVRRINLDLLYPEYTRRLLDLLAECEAQGQHFIANSGFRSFQEQAKLYFQGRTTPGPIVTNAGPGRSAHNFGIAVDVVRDADLVLAGLQPRWDGAGYTLLAQLGPKHGLQVGVPTIKGGDPGHIQLPLSKTYGKAEADVLTTLRAAHTKGGMKAAWAALDLKYLTPAT